MRRKTIEERIKDKLTEAEVALQWYREDFPNPDLAKEQQIKINLLKELLGGK